MLEELEPIDREIVKLLLKNCRISNAEIARRVHLSRVAVRERIQNLVQKGIIQEFTVILNASALGYNIAAFFEIEVQPDKLEVVAQELARQEQVNIVYHMTGPSSLHVHAYLKDSDHLATFMRDHIYSIPGVQRVNSCLLLRRFKSVLSIR